MKQLKDYLHFYKDVLVKVKKMYDNDYHVGRVCEISSKSNHGDWIIVWFDNVITVTNNTHNQLSSNAHHYFFGEDDIKPILRPLSDMTEDEILEVCKLFSPTAWGEYRFKKWVAKKDPKSNDSWIYYDVTNENSTYSFTVDLIDGDIMLYDDDDYEPIHVDNNYRFWYVRNGFDIFGLIGSGLAIDKTTYNPKQV